MHHKLTKHGRFCKQNNQLPTKTHVELKDNSNTPQTNKGKPKYTNQIKNKNNIGAFYLHQRE
jgi:hypothetical protein